MFLLVSTGWVFLPPSPREVASPWRSRRESFCVLRSALCVPIHNWLSVVGRWFYVSDSFYGAGLLLLTIRVVCGGAGLLLLTRRVVCGGAADV